jgi:hypothetical protein
MISTHSYAKWVEFDTVNDNGRVSIYYFDLSTIKRNGSEARIWALRENSFFQTLPDGNKYMSGAVLWSFDCLEEKSDILSSIFFSDRKGNKVIKNESYPERDYKHVVPNTHTATIFKVACNK